MGSVIKNGYERRIVGEIQSKKGVIRVQQWTAPLAANATLILNGQSLAAGGTVTAFAGQPDFPRNVQVVASGATTASVVVNGTNIRGVAISETLVLAGTTPVLGNKAFATITSVALPTVASTTINLGTGVKLGLDRMLYADSLFQSETDGAHDTTRATIAYSTTGVESNTIITNTAPNGTHVFTASYITKELTTAKQTTA